MSELLMRRVWAGMQMFCVGCWLCVWTTEVPPTLGMPPWLQALCNLCMFLFVGRNIWRSETARARDIAQPLDDCMGSSWKD